MIRFGLQKNIFSPPLQRRNFVRRAKQGGSPLNRSMRKFIEIFRNDIIPKHCFLSLIRVVSVPPGYFLYSFVHSKKAGILKFLVDHETIAEGSSKLNTAFTSHTLTCIEKSIGSEKLSYSICILPMALGREHPLFPTLQMGKGDFYLYGFVIGIHLAPKLEELLNDYPLKEGASRFFQDENLPHFS